MRPRKFPTLISPSELSDLMKAEPVVLIDTRDPAIYAEAHIPGAVDVREVFIYLANSTPEGMAALQDTFAAAFGKAGLSGAETAVTYEQPMSAGFGQSCRGYVLLRYLGYPKIRVCTENLNPDIVMMKSAKDRV